MALGGPGPEEDRWVGFWRPVHQGVSVGNRSKFSETSEPGVGASAMICEMIPEGDSGGAMGGVVRVLGAGRCCCCGGVV